jgi:hypothetical protein
MFVLINTTSATQHKLVHMHVLQQQACVRTHDACAAAAVAAALMHSLPANLSMVAATLQLTAGGVCHMWLACSCTAAQHRN